MTVSGLGRCAVAAALLLGCAQAFAEDPTTTTPSGGTTTAAPTPAGGVPAADAEAEASELHRDILSVDQDVRHLKERVFRSKATLQLLSELVLDGSAQGSSLQVSHSNRLGAAYALESVEIKLDAKTVFTRTDATGTLDSNDRDFQVLSQPVNAGQHTLQVVYLLRGNGMGVFSYLETYSFRVEGTYTFNVEEGHQTSLVAIANERGGPWRSFVDRPVVEYEETTAVLGSSGGSPQ